MKRSTLILLAIMAVSPIFAQSGDKSTPGTEIQTITVASKGQDVRDILADVFTQAKKSFVVQPNIHFALFLSLNDVEFEEALGLICKTADLKYELQNGIYFVTRDKASSTAQPATASAPSGKLPPKTLAKKVTVRFRKTDLRLLFSALSTQSGVPIEVDPKVPEYKVDVVLNGVTLKYALQNVCRAAGLTYKFTDHLSLAIVPKEDPNASLVRVDSH